MKYEIVSIPGVPSSDVKIVATDLYFCREIVEVTKETLEGNVPESFKELAFKLLAIEGIVLLSFDEEGRIEIEKDPDCSWEELTPLVESVLILF